MDEITEPTTLQEEAPREGGAAAVRHVHVLVVEDDPRIRELVRWTLRDAGYAVTLAATGEEAVTLLGTARLSFDAVVLDLNLPGIPGRAVLVKSRELRPGLPVLVVTGDPGVTAELADGVIEKPYDLRELVVRLRHAIARGRASGVLAHY